MTRVLDPVWIELSDGCRLAARVWLPDAVVSQPCPTILEAIPYRRIDGTLTIDQPRYDWWARRGFAGVRVDLRGAGDSDDLLYDEYLRQEQDDDLEVLAWIAAQPWSNGRVGMIGYSWGGFAGLQVAARTPPQLGAVVTVNSTVRRYTDDCHYIGGAVNAHDMLSWATTMLAFDARPPDPEVVGDRWREMWERRLDVAPPMVEHWLAHQLEDEYWRHGSVAFQYEAINSPVLAVGGWSDPYRNAVLDLLANLSGDRFGLIGPWAHGYPHDTAPGPNIAFLTECERFFGRYLRDDDNGYENTPALRAYMQSFDRPAAYQEQRAGHWVAVGDWPPADAEPLELTFGTGTLSSASQSLPAGPRVLQVAAAQANGLAAGNWCPYGGPSQPLDQRADDALSLCLDSEPVGAPVEILGFPRLSVRVASDRPRAILAARLCDVSPTGESLLVTRGILNLTHRDGHEVARPLAPGEPVDVSLRLDCAGHRFAQGHRIRLALSPTYWPWVWPSPEPVTLAFDPAFGRLTLPTLGAHDPCELGPAEETEPVVLEWVTQSPFSQTVSRDVTNGRVTLTSQADFLAGRRRLVDLGLEAEDWGENVYRIDEHDPLAAQVVVRRRAGLHRPGWDVRIEADATMSADAEQFRVDTELRAFEAGRLVRTQRFQTRLPRRD